MLFNEYHSESKLFIMKSKLFIPILCVIAIGAIYFGKDYSNVKAGGMMNSALSNSSATPNDEGGGECGSINSATISYASAAFQLSATNKSFLDALASDMRNNPACRVVVVGHGNGNKVEQQLSWDRVSTCISYMIEVQQIDRERFIFQYGAEGSASTVSYRPAAESELGPSNVPPPFPDMKQAK